MPRRQPRSPSMGLTSESLWILSSTASTAMPSSCCHAATTHALSPSSMLHWHTRRDAIWSEIAPSERASTQHTTQTQTKRRNKQHQEQEQASERGGGPWPSSRRRPSSRRWGGTRGAGGRGGGW
eukprot:3790728-Rhodomonas_salina.1